ncbi:MAG: hypothetical protein Q4G24_16210 [Paracoccus sp. (in: a-proteobacteria)]|uniref:hypothetical protein n=1 Tax=Paracoccus sp. TaxID=267 RepID=UPI0026DEB314|nr:hypothetical protein [Paracoccus sp. (in: a-proteobacteria)]MDO5622990.1 hypothetical protein [Paracoccus sp. (in: a-proteobacteria)]
MTSQYASISLRLKVPEEFADRLRGYIGIQVHNPSNGFAFVDVNETGPDGLRFIADALDDRLDRWPRPRSR